MRESKWRAPRTADTRRLRSAQRSGRAIETAGRKAGFFCDETRHKRFAGKNVSRDANHGRDEADKVGVQRATSIGRISTVVVVTMLMRLACVAMMRMLRGERGERAVRGFRARKGRRYNAGELGHHEKGDQEPDKPGYRPQPIHQ